MPFATHEGRVCPERFNPQIREFELAHLVAGTLIGRFIAIHSFLPSVTFVRSREERQFRRLPVSGHEGVEVVMVPRILLRSENLFYGRLGVTRLSEAIR